VRVPSGWMAPGFFWPGVGRADKALVELFDVIELAMVALVVAYGLLLHFYRQVGRVAGRAGQTREANPFAREGTRFRALVEREALDLWHNPKARLLASVPVLLSILLKLLSGRALFVFLLGRTADAALLGFFCLYGATVMCITFAQNAFAYDGHGFALFLASPTELAQVLRAKNAAHALAGALVALLVAAFYLVYFGKGTGLDAACALAAVACVIPVLLCAGNFLSLYFPVK